MIFSTTYLPNIAYYTAFLADDAPCMEVCENFVKQTYRNRCDILAANGVLKLVIPVEYARSKKIKIKDVKIAYYETWQKRHWRSIVSAYSSSPFFEYFADEFAPFYTNKYTFLYDFNTSLFRTINRTINLSVSPTKTDYYNTNNSLNIYSSKACNMSFRKYPQVFDFKFGFVENLSIIDLLFNVGTEAKYYLTTNN
ncbi:MAG: WbqC family protein [Bacteroidales bacterium]